MENAAWKPVVAALANPETRRVLAELMLGGTLEAATAELSPSTRRRVTGAVLRSGVVDPDSHAFTPDALRAMLAASATPRKEGIERFLRGTRIAQYPANAAEHRALLAWVANDAFEPGDVLREREVNDRLRAYSADVAVLRRYLVDHELLERRADGSEYALVASG